MDGTVPDYRIETWRDKPMFSDTYFKWEVHRTSHTVFSKPFTDVLVASGTADYRWSARWRARRAAKKHAKGYSFTDERRRVESVRYTK
jgi:hypothetical protein